mmetsp:Transcript_88283/g.252508  ORF Transcript_88283/g.252508 Transcript_88283/m.252508 type:complete len:361 (+) Transcript_88283:430-1512(+)
MLLGRPPTDTEITSVSGSVSGAAATFAKQPIQRMKWIRQVNEKASVPYRTIISDTLAKRGVIGLFSGSMAGIYRNVPHSAIVYTVFPHCDNFVAKITGENSKKSFWTRFWAGYITLFLTTAITHPLDTLRVRLSVHTDSARYRFVQGRHHTKSTRLVVSVWPVWPPVGPVCYLRFLIGYSTSAARSRASDTTRLNALSPHAPNRMGFFGSAKHLFNTEGLTAYYRGFAATLVGAGPRGALGFGIFETLKPACKQIEVLRDNPAMSKFLCGYLAGAASEFFIYPLDTVRRRQQALGKNTCLSSKSVTKALVHIYTTEGLKGMYKGIMLNLFKNPMATAVSFAVNDLVKEALGYEENEHPVA